MKIENGVLHYVNFGNVLDGEINDIHLAVLFKIKGLNNVVFAVPLTSPKLKHFKNEVAFNTRNYLETKYMRLHYIRQTDSIALFDQLKTISKRRVCKAYKNSVGDNIKLNYHEISVLKTKIIKYLKYILYE